MADTISTEAIRSCLQRQSPMLLQRSWLRDPPSYNKTQEFHRVVRCQFDESHSQVFPHDVMQQERGPYDCARRWNTLTITGFRAYGWSPSNRQQGGVYVTDAFQVRLLGTLNEDPELIYDARSDGKHRAYLDVQLPYRPLWTFDMTQPTHTYLLLWNMNVGAIEYIDFDCILS